MMLNYIIYLFYLGTGGDNVWCDHFQVQVINQCALIAIADGCNWGSRPKKAAETACKLTQEHITKEIDSWHQSKSAHNLSFSMRKKEWAKE